MHENRMWIIREETLLYVHNSMVKLVCSTKLYVSNVTHFSDIVLSDPLETESGNLRGLLPKWLKKKKIACAMLENFHIASLLLPNFLQ